MSYLLADAAVPWGPTTLARGMLNPSTDVAPLTLTEPTLTGMIDKYGHGWLGGQYVLGAS